MTYPTIVTVEGPSFRVILPNGVNLWFSLDLCHGEITQQAHETRNRADALEAVDRYLAATETVNHTPNPVYSHPTTTHP